MLHVDDFFIPTNAIENIPEEEYEKNTPLISTLDSLTRVLYHSIYVIDYYKKNFLYVSDNPHLPQKRKTAGIHTHPLHAFIFGQAGVLTVNYSILA